MFDVQLQRPITLKLNSIDDSVFGYIGFVIEDGVVDSIPSLEIMDHPNILTYVPQVSVGEVCERSRFSGQASAIFVVRSKDIKSLVTTYKDIKEMFENNMKYRSIEESV